MSKKEKTAKYTYTYNPSNNIVTKTDLATGNTWDYLARPKNVKPDYSASNGVTVEALQRAGNNVRVKHLRWAIYWQHEPVLKNRQGEVSRVMVVPSTFRKDPNYMMLPKGGFTHVVIKKADGEYVCVSSECSQDDPFCYAAGVSRALERLRPSQIRELLPAEEL
jgi:hypothetical protein